MPSTCARETREIRHRRDRADDPDPRSTIAIADLLSHA